MDIGDIVIYVADANTRKVKEYPAIVVKVGLDDTLDLFVFSKDAHYDEAVPRLASGVTDGRNAWEPKPDGVDSNERGPVPGPEYG